MHTAQLSFRFPWGQPVQSAQLCFSLPCGQGLHATQACFTLPCGQGLQSSQLRFALPCEHSFSPIFTIYSLVTSARTTFALHAHYVCAPRAPRRERGVVALTDFISLRPRKSFEKRNFFTRVSFPNPATHHSRILRRGARGQPYRGIVSSQLPWKGVCTRCHGQYVSHQVAPPLRVEDRLRRGVVFAEYHCFGGGRCFSYASPSRRNRTPVHAN